MMKRNHCVSQSSSVRVSRAYARTNVDHKSQVHSDYDHTVDALLEESGSVARTGLEYG